MKLILPRSDLGDSYLALFSTKTEPKSELCRPRGTRNLYELIYCVSLRPIGTPYFILI